MGGLEFRVLARICTPVEESRGGCKNYSCQMSLRGREYLKNLLWFRSCFGNQNPEQVAIVSIRNLIAIQGCDTNRNNDRNPGQNPG